MYQSNRNLFKRRRNCFYDMHKWLDDVEVEQVDLRNAPKRLRKTVKVKNILFGKHWIIKIVYVFNKILGIISVSE